MNVDVLRNCYKKLCLPPAKTLAYQFYKQFLDLTFDMVLKLDIDNPAQRDIIFDAFLDVENLRNLYIEKPKGWKAMLHKIRTDFIEAGKNSDVRPEWDISTKRWVWISKHTEELFDSLDL